MNQQHLKASYDRDGFVVVPQFLPNEQFAELKKELDRYIQTVVPTLQTWNPFTGSGRSSPQGPSPSLTGNRSSMGVSGSIGSGSIGPGSMAPGFIVEGDRRWSEIEDTL